MQKNINKPGCSLRNKEYGNFGFWSLRLKAPTEDAERTWFGNEFQRFITRLENYLPSRAEYTLVS